MPFPKGTVMSFGLVWLLLTGCQETSPYLRNLQPAYNQDGSLDRESYRINKAWIRHMLHDLDACYKEAD
jgi:hypothetical protein